MGVDDLTVSNFGSRGQIGVVARISGGTELVTNRV